MKTLLNVIAAAVLGASLFTGTAFADHGRDAGAGENHCVIEYTGPGSYNSCSQEDKDVFICKNENGVIVDNETRQEAETGDVVVEDNTTVGDVESGDAINENTTVVAIDIVSTCAPLEDKEEEKPGQGAGPEKEKPVKEQEKDCDNDTNGHNDRNGDDDQACPVAAPVGGMGGFTALPATAAESPAMFAAIAALALGGIALASRLSVAAYARFKA